MNTVAVFLSNKTRLRGAGAGDSPRRVTRRSN